MTSLFSFMKIYQLVWKLLVWDTQAGRQTDCWFHNSPFHLLKKSRLKDLNKSSIFFVNVLSYMKRLYTVCASAVYDEKFRSTKTGWSLQYHDAHKFHENRWISVCKTWWFNFLLPSSQEQFTCWTQEQETPPGTIVWTLSAIFIIFNVCSEMTNYHIMCILSVKRKFTAFLCKNYYIVIYYFKFATVTACIWHNFYLKNIYILW
jgi:hypothetical protein